MLESIPALQALTGTMAAISSDTSQVTSQLSLPAGAQAGTGLRRLMLVTGTVKGAIPNTLLSSSQHSGGGQLQGGL